jgi:hypothetical protein
VPNIFHLLVHLEQTAKKKRNVDFNKNEEKNENQLSIKVVPFEIFSIVF